MTSKSTAVGAPLKAKELGWMTHLIPTLEAEIQKILQLSLHVSAAPHNFLKVPISQVSKVAT